MKVGSMIKSGSVSALLLGISLGGSGFWLAAGRPMPGSGLRAPIRLDGTRLPGAALAGKNLSYCTLARADLTDVDLGLSNLQHANLREANLHGANLGAADLRNADLQGANLRGTNLHGAVLTGALLDGAQYDPSTSWPEGVDPIQLGAVPDPDRRSRSAEVPAPVLGPLEPTVAPAQVMLRPEVH